jgi:hypothetical protein
VNDVWAYGGTGWTQLLPDTSGPSLGPPNTYGGGAWDTARQRGVLLGDVRVSSAPYRLEWLGADYVVIEPTSTERWALDQRDKTAVAFDVRRGRTVLFGGADQASSSRTLGDTWEVDADLDQGLQRRSPAVQLSVRHGTAGFGVSQVTGLRVRARAGGDFAPAGAGARLLGWHRGGIDNPGGRWIALADNVDGVPLAASPDGLIDWTASAAERQRFFRERDSELAFRLRPAGAPPAMANESVVQAEYLEVRIRYTTAP